MMSKEGPNILPAFAGTETLEKNFKSISDSFEIEKYEKAKFKKSENKNDVTRGTEDFFRIYQDKNLGEDFQPDFYIF